MSSIFIHTTARVRIPFLFMEKEYSIVLIYHILFIFHLSMNTLLASSFWLLWILLFTARVELTRKWNCWIIPNSTFGFLRDHHILFHSGYTDFYSHQRCVRVLTSSHPCQHLLIFFLFFSSLFFCLIVVILTGVRWHLIVVSICISSTFPCATPSFPLVDSNPVD